MDFFKLFNGIQDWNGSKKNFECKNETRFFCNSVQPNFKTPLILAPNKSSFDSIDAQRGKG